MLSSAVIGTEIDIAADHLRAGRLVAIPTETVYGLAANAFDEYAVAAIFKAKNRPQFNPLIIHTDRIARLSGWGLQMPDLALALAARYSPGPLTYVLPASDRIPDIVTAGSGAVAVRIPDHPLTLALLSVLDFPLAAPSANPSGFVSPTTAQHVFDQLGQQIGYILDGGPCRVGLESTILSFLEDTPTLLRPGGLPLEAIEKLIGPVRIPPSGYSDNPVAPGMLARHYATRHPLLLGDPERFMGHCDPGRTAIISFCKTYPQVPLNQQFVLSANQNLEEAATRLFAAMREADAMEIDVILAEIFPDHGLGRAINDRLRRAAETQ